MNTILKRLTAFMVLTLALLMAACAAPAEEPAEEEPAVEEEAEEEAPAEEEEMEEEAPDEEMEEEMDEEMADGEPQYRIGVSNGFVGSEWRGQMIRNMEEVAEELNVELIIESGDVDIPGQQQQIQNLLNQDIDALLVNPNSTDALNPVLEEAVEAGVVVVAIDGEVSAQGVPTVTIDQTEWGRIISEWLFENLESGDIVVIEGFVGHPANEYRMTGFDEVLANYPDINVVARDSGSWDQATAQQVMSDFLASTPNIDGVWVQDGMAVGSLRAVRTANPEEYPLMLGECRVDYLLLWEEVLAENPDFSAFCAVNPPGLGASGLRIAYELLEGGELDESQLEGGFDSTIHVPIPYTISDDNFAEQLEMFRNEPESFHMDGIITQEEAQSYMQ